MSSSERSFDGSNSHLSPAIRPNEASGHELVTGVSHSRHGPAGDRSGGMRLAWQARLPQGSANGRLVSVEWLAGKAKADEDFSWRAGGTWRVHFSAGNWRGPRAEDFVDVAASLRNTQYRRDAWRMIERDVLVLTKYHRERERQKSQMR